MAIRTGMLYRTKTIPRFEQEATQVKEAKKFIESGRTKVWALKKVAQAHGLLVYERSRLRRKINALPNRKVDESSGQQDTLPNGLLRNREPQFTPWMDPFQLDRFKMDPIKFNWTMGYH